MTGMTFYGPVATRAWLMADQFAQCRGLILGGVACAVLLVRIEPVPKWCALPVWTGLVWQSSGKSRVPVQLQKRVLWSKL